MIELGFFDTDTDASTWTPNTDTSDIFNGTWTPITGTTTIGHKTSSGDSFVGAGKFAFQTKFFDSEDQGSAPSADVYDATGPVYYDQVSETNYGASSPYKIAETSLLTFTKKSTHWTLHLIPLSVFAFMIWIPLQMLKGQTPILIRTMVHPDTIP